MLLACVYNHHQVSVNYKRFYTKSRSINRRVVCLCVGKAAGGDGKALVSCDTRTNKPLECVFCACLARRSVANQVSTDDVKSELT